MGTLLVKNGTVVTASDEFVADIYAENGKIVEIGKNLTIQADTEVDATGKYVMPGGVDQHTHFNFKFGDAVVMGWETTTGAVAGGTTTVIDFANQEIGKSMKASVDDYVSEKIEGKACCDYNLHTVVFESKDEIINEIEKLPEYGISTCKLFMAYKGHPQHCDDDTVLKAMMKAAPAGVTIMTHCENAEMIDVLQKQCLAKGQTEPYGHAVSRPPIVETEATERAISLAKPGFEGAKYVCSPALRGQEDLDALWDAINQGVLNAISSDHCGFNYSVHKQQGKDDFTMIPNGAPGMQDRMQVVWTYGVATGKISRQKYVEVCCTNPAKNNGIYPQKGSLSIGADADIMIFDPDYEDVFSVKNSLQKGVSSREFGRRLWKIYGHCRNG